MAHQKRTLSDDDLLEAVEAVLTGQITRDQLSYQGELTPIDHRHTLAFVGIALVLATRYRINDEGRTLEPLSDILHTLVYKDTQAAREYEIGMSLYDVRSTLLQRSASMLGLHEPGSRSGMQGLVLNPPDALKELVAKHRNNPAVYKFLEDAGIRDDRAEVLVRQEAVCVVTTFRNKRGREGLEVLLEELRAALEEK